MLIAELRERAPIFVAALAEQDPALLGLDLAAALERHFAACFVAMESAQTGAYADTIGLADLSRNLLINVVDLKSVVTGPALTSLNFLQLSICLSALGQCLSTGQLARAGDWVISSLNDELAFGDAIAHGNADMTRLDDFMSSNNGFIALNWPSLLCQWYTATYMYCSVTNSFQEFALLLVPYALTAINAGFANGQNVAVDALARLAQWAGAQNAEIAQSLGRDIERLYLDGSEPFAPQLAAALLTAAAHGTARSSKEWATVIREKHWQDVDVATRLRIIVRFASEDDAFETYRQELLETIEEFQRSSGTAATFDREQWREATFVTMYPVLNALMRAGDVAALIEIIGAWYNVTPDERIGDILFVAPFMKADTLWAGPREVLTFDHISATLPQDATTIINLALRLVIGHQGHTGLAAPHDPGRRGIPDFERAATFERTLTDLLALRSLPRGAFSDAEAAIPFIPNPIPFQALCTRTLGRTWPISVSLRKPATARHISKVGIWLHPLLHGEVERDVAMRLFEASGIECVAKSSGEDDDRDRFLRFYSCDDFDVIWVIGHAERRSFAPEESNLDILSQGTLTLQDLANIGFPATSDRRLLVLNACSAGGSASYGAIGRIGIAALLASPQQATVAHLWLSEPVAAMTFGIFLAQSLAQRMSFFGAFQKSLVTTNAKKKAVLSALRQIEHADEAASILERSPVETENILVTGSPVFLQ